MSHPENTKILEAEYEAFMERMGMELNELLNQQHWWASVNSDEEYIQQWEEGHAD